MRKKIELRMSPTDALAIMAEGNPGAISAMIKLMDNPNGFFDVLRLDDMNMRGPQIWVAFKDVCKGDVELFRQKIRERDSAMITQVNKEMFMDESWKEHAKGPAGHQDDSR